MAFKTQWRRCQPGEWFFMDSPSYESRYSVQERTDGGCSIVCSTPYVHERAKAQMKLIARLHNEAIAKVLGGEK